MTDLNPEFVELRQKFRLFYERELLALFAPMEATRKKYLGCFWALSILSFFIVSTIGSIYISIERAPGEDETELFFALILILIGICSMSISSYKKSIKGNVMEKMISFFGDFSYSYGSKIGFEILAKSKLFSSPTSRTGDDHFQGKYKGVGITVSEEKHVVRGGKNRRTTFRGIIILLEMDKPFTGRTVVKKDHGWLLNKFESSLWANLGKKVALEDVVFEKYFEAYSNDQIEARYLLTTAFMERILKVRDAFDGSSIEFSFFDNNLLIKIPTNKDMFETSSLFSSATDYSRVEEAFDQFCSVFSIVDILKLTAKA